TALPVVSCTAREPRCVVALHWSLSIVEDATDSPARPTPEGRTGRDLTVGGGAGTSAARATPPAPGALVVLAAEQLVRQGRQIVQRGLLRPVRAGSLAAALLPVGRRPGVRVLDLRQLAGA